MHEALQHFVLCHRQVRESQRRSGVEGATRTYLERDPATGLERGGGAGVGDDAWNVPATSARS
ncbi:MAG: hypothetical protein HKO03_11630 [Acidimicrobiia bacterium]|nr:hypothetical protein [Acidimicrobiia bacterium]